MILITMPTMMATETIMAMMTMMSIKTIRPFEDRLAENQKRAEFKLQELPCLEIMLCAQVEVLVTLAFMFVSSE